MGDEKDDIDIDILGQQHFLRKALRMLTMDASSGSGMRSDLLQRCLAAHFR